VVENDSIGTVDPDKIQDPEMPTPSSIASSAFELGQEPDSVEQSSTDVPEIKNDDSLELPSIKKSDLLKPDLPELGAEPTDKKSDVGHVDLVIPKQPEQISQASEPIIIQSTSTNATEIKTSSHTIERIETQPSTIINLTVEGNSPIERDEIRTVQSNQILPAEETDAVVQPQTSNRSDFDELLNLLKLSAPTESNDESYSSSPASSALAAANMDEPKSIELPTIKQSSLSQTTELPVNSEQSVRDIFNGVIPTIAEVSRVALTEIANVINTEHTTINKERGNDITLPSILSADSMDESTQPNLSQLRTSIATMPIDSITQTDASAIESNDNTSNQNPSSSQPQSNYETSNPTNIAKLASESAQHTNAEQIASFTSSNLDAKIESAIDSDKRKQLGLQTFDSGSDARVDNKIQALTPTLVQRILATPEAAGLKTINESLAAVKSTLDATKALQVSNNQTANSVSNSSMIVNNTESMKSEKSEPAKSIEAKVEEPKPDENKNTLGLSEFYLHAIYDALTSQGIRIKSYS
jgi:hypothetical protein